MYLFLLTINNSGSTAFSNFLATSPSVYLPPFGNNEGQMHPQVKPLMRNQQQWRPDFPVAWDQVKPIWDQLLEESGKSIFLEASPPNIIRAEAIRQAFPGSRFIVFLNNPYSFCGSMWFRYCTQDDKRAYMAASARKWVERAKMQLKNLQSIDDALFVSYERFCDDVPGVRVEMLERIPQLGALDAEAVVKVKGRAAPVRNMNDRNIALVGSEHLKAVNQVFEGNRDLLTHFGYDLMEPGEMATLLSDDGIASAVARRTAGKDVMLAIEKKDAERVLAALGVFLPLADAKFAIKKRLRVEAREANWQQLRQRMRRLL